MITTSDYYKAHIEDKTLRWEPKVVIDYTDYNIDNTIEVTVDSPHYTSFDGQIADGIESPSAKYWDFNNFEWGMALSSATDEQYEHGAVSEQMSGADRTFTANAGAFLGASFLGAGFLTEQVRKPSFTVSFGERLINSFRVVFDDKLNQYGEEFDIEVYTGTTLTTTETVTGNTGVVWTKDLATALSDITSLKLTINKWSTAGSHARVLEFYTSVQETYEGDDVLSISVFEESDIDKATSPVGNLSANTCDIKLVNRNSLFDNDNEDSPLQNNLIKNRRIMPYLGLYNDRGDDGKINFIPLGTFYSQEWTNDNYAGTAGVSGRDIVQLMEENEYNTDQFVETPSAQTVVYTSTADFDAFADFNTVAVNDQLQFGGEAWEYNRNSGAYLGASFLGSGFLAGSTYYGYATRTFSYNYTSGTSAKITLSTTSSIQNGDLINYSLSFDSGVTYNQITDNISYVPSISGTSQSVILKVEFITQNPAGSLSVQDISLNIEGFVTLKSLAIKVLEDFDDATGILEGNYTIADELGEINIPNAYLEAQTFRDALRLICEAGAAHGFIDRDGRFIIERLGQEPDYVITRTEENYRQVQKITNPDDLYNRVTVKVNPLTAATSATVISSLAESVPASTSKDFTLYYTDVPAADVVFTSSVLPSSVTITDSTAYTWGADITVTNANATEQDITLVAEGKPYTVDGSFNVQLDDSASIRKSGVQELLIDNSLIQIADQADDITALLINTFKNQQRIIEADILPDPSLEISDGADIDSKGYRIYNQEIDYGDGVSQIIKGVKV